VASTVPQVDQPGDAELISAVRGGDVDAYGQLFARHVGAARRLARQLVAPGEADDLVSEAFVKVLTVLQRGGGPDVAFRAYLLTAVRRLRVDRLRAGSRLQTTDDMEMFDPGIPFRDTAVEGFESAAAARAFASLPERWQLVLWHTEVEGHKPADVAPLLGMSPNSVSALAYRAREGLRQAFLNQHAEEAEEDLCRWTHQHLGGYVRGGLSRRDTARVEGHLGECRRCMAIYLELTEVNDNLAGLLAPLLLGGAASGYVAATQGGLATGGVIAVLDRVRDAVLAHTGATVAGGVVAASVVVGGTWWAVQDDAPPPAIVAPSAEPAEDGDPSAEPGTDPRTEPRTAAPGRPDRGRPAIAEPGGAPAAGEAAPVEPPSPTATTPPATTDAGPTTPPTGDTDEGPGAPSPGGDPVEATPGPGGGNPDGEQPGPIEDAVDLTVSAALTSSLGPQHDLTASVAGIPPGGSATLTVTASGGVTALRSAECAQGTGLTLTCTLGTDGTIAILAVSPTGGTVSFSVSGTSPDPDPSDNTTSITLD
jgi:RNA polymerase sigma factor (sigma-70 family)